MKKLSLAAALLAALTLGFLFQRKISPLAPGAKPAISVASTASAASPTEPGARVQDPEPDPLSSLARARSGFPFSDRTRRTASLNPAAARSTDARTAQLHRRLRPAPSDRAAAPTKPIPDPEARKYQLWEDLFRSTLADFFNAHAVDSSTQRQIIDLLIEERLGMFDLVNLGREQNLSRHDRSSLLTAHLNAAKAAMDAAVGKEMTDALYLNLGSPAYEPYTAEFANRCARQGIAVTPDVAEWTGRTNKMYQVTAMRSKQISAVQLQTTLNGLVISQAATKLTPAQLEVFKQMLTDQLNRLAQQSPPGS